MDEDIENAELITYVEPMDIAHNVNLFINRETSLLTTAYQRLFTVAAHVDTFEC